MSIEVNIYEVPGRKTTVNMNGTNGDWAKALELGGIAADGRDITVNGGTPEDGKAMANGDRITLAKGAKGNCAS